MFTSAFVTYALCSNLYWTNEKQFTEMKCPRYLIEQEVYLTKEWKYD